MAFLKHIFLVIASVVTFGLVDKPVAKPIPTASPSPFVLQIEATPSPTARSVDVTQTPKPRASLTPSSIPVVVFTPIYTSAPTATPKLYDACDNIEGIQSVVPSGMYPDGNWKCLPLRQATPTPQVVIQQQPNPQVEAQARYDAQYQIVQAKVRSLQSQLDELLAVSSSPTCSQFTQGATQQDCLRAAQQAAAISSYQASLLATFRALTPVTDISVAYENQIDGLQQQIFQIKMSYYEQVSLIRGVDLQFAQGEQQNLLAAANAKIASLQQQIQTAFLRYQSGMTP